VRRSPSHRINTVQANQDVREMQMLHTDVGARVATVAAIAGPMASVFIWWSSRVDTRPDETEWKRTS